MKQEMNSLTNIENMSEETLTKKFMQCGYTEAEAKKLTRDFNKFGIKEANFRSCDHG